MRLDAVLGSSFFTEEPHRWRNVTMKVQHCVLLACLLALISVGASAGNEPAASEVVAELWFLSPRFAVTQPEVAVLANGLMRVHQEQGQVIEGQLSAAELTALHQELLVTCGLGSLDSRQLAAEIQVTAQQHQLTASIPNADETVIRVRDTAGRLREIRCPAVGLLAGRFPSVAGLQGLNRAQLRLQNLRSILQVGGSDAAAGIAEYASESLKEHNPAARPLTVDELAMVRRFPDGTRYIQFCRHEIVEGASAAPLIVAVTEVPGGQPKVSVFGGTGIRR